MNMSAQAAFIEITQGTTKSVAAAVTLGIRRQICLDFDNSLTGAPALVHLWRTAEPGGSKDLGNALGRHCLNTKGAKYTVRVMAIDANVTVRVADEFALTDLPSAR